MPVAFLCLCVGNRIGFPSLALLVLGALHRPSVELFCFDLIRVQVTSGHAGAGVEGGPDRPQRKRYPPCFPLVHAHKEHDTRQEARHPPAAAMAWYEQDPDVIRWGLHQLLPHAAPVQTTATSPYTAYAPHHPTSSSSFDIKVEHVDSDHTIAQALQEELSQVALAEASSSAADQHNHSTVLTQQWLNPRNVHIDSPDDEPTREEQPFSSCSSPGDDNVQGAEPLLIELMDDFSVIDGQVGKRLNDMVPVPHVPKTNGEIPSVDEAVSDHQRLLHRLALYGLVELKVNGDGNCQFRALSDQFYRTPEHHRFVRQQVVSQLESHPEMYAGYVPMDYRDYLKKMSKSGEWGDHVTLQAAADSYGVKVFILTSFKDTCYIEILPVVEKSRRVICLSFWAEVHYNSIYPEGELPVSENKKKSWWPF